MIPNEFGTVLERLEKLERLERLERLEVELEIQYSQPEQEIISHNRLLHSLCVSLSLQSTLWLVET